MTLAMTDEQYRSISAKILGRFGGHRFIYPASAARIVEEPGVLVWRALDRMVEDGILAVWEVPEYRRHSFEDEAKPGTGNEWEGLLDDDLDEIPSDMVQALKAYRRVDAAVPA